MTDALERDGICEMGMCLTLIDPHTLPLLRGEERQVLQSELTGTGAVIWTKTDVPPAVNLAEAARQAGECLSLDGQAPLQFYPKAAHLLDGEGFAALQQAVPVRRRHRTALVNHVALFQSTALRPKKRYTCETAWQAVDAVLGDADCGEIVRIKGFVRTGEGCAAINCTVSDRLIEPCPARRPMLNVIGRRLDRARIQSALDRFGVSG